MALYLCIILVLCGALLSGQVAAESVFITSSTVWTPPSGVTQINVTLWGGGGGGSAGCVVSGGGGSGGAIVGRIVTINPSMGDVNITIGAGGTGGTFPSVVGGNGGNTVVSHAGTVLTAYGGGGGYTNCFEFTQTSKYTAMGGGGGGSGGRAAGPVGGISDGVGPSGPSGGVSPGIPPTSVGDQYSGGSGGGALGACSVTLYVCTNFTMNGASWPSRFTGGYGLGNQQASSSYPFVVSGGGAAGYNGAGGNGGFWELVPPTAVGAEVSSRPTAGGSASANSGAGGGGGGFNSVGNTGPGGSGGSGGCIIEY